MYLVVERRKFVLKWLWVAVALLLLFGCGGDFVSSSEPADKDVCYNPSVGLIPDLARRGCCSHHGGVCGCDEASDRIRCCDGSLSPSCTCSGY